MKQLVLVLALALVGPVGALAETAPPPPGVVGIVCNDGTKISLADATATSPPVARTTPCDSHGGIKSVICVDGSIVAPKSDPCSGATGGGGSPEGTAAKPVCSFISKGPDGTAGYLCVFAPGAVLPKIPEFCSPQPDGPKGEKVFFCHPPQPPVEQQQGGGGKKPAVCDGGIGAESKSPALRALRLPTNDNPPTCVPGLKSSFLNRVWKFGADADSYNMASNILNLTVTKIYNLPKRFADQDEAFVDQDADVLLSATTRVYDEDGKRIRTESAINNALDNANSLRVFAKVVKPSKWNKDADDVPVPTLRAKRILIVSSDS